MTRQKTFKRDVRARMAKTGERYTAARRQLIDADSPAQPVSAQPNFEAPTSEKALRDATGRGWDEWFALLDEWEATAQNHTEIARWLAANHETSSWWVQTITVAYERARGLRQKHQLASGYSVGATRTVDASPARAFGAFVDPAQRVGWLPDTELRERTSRADRSARFDWPDGSRLVVDLAAKARDRTTISIQHEKLADADRAARMKTFWRERLSALKKLLES
jgi:hypothetical protein